MIIVRFERIVACIRPGEYFEAFSRGGFFWTLSRASCNVLFGKTLNVQYIILWAAVCAEEVCSYTLYSIGIMCIKYIKHFVIIQ